MSEKYCGLELIIKQKLPTWVGPMILA
jgi:hypothetical protein